MQKIGIFYGTVTGNTESAAKQMQEIFGSDYAQLFDVSKASSSNLEKFDNIIFGASTWGVGDMQDDFETFLSEIKKANLKNKKIAIFGLGDQEGFSDSFVDAIGEIYENIELSGCQIIGISPTEGYDYSASRAEIDGKFVGLPLDDDNQPDLTKKRIENWVKQIKAQFN